MARITTLSVDINVNITDETAVKCLNILNMYLEGNPGYRLKEEKHNNVNEKFSFMDFYSYSIDITPPDLENLNV